MTAALPLDRRGVLLGLSAAVPVAVLAPGRAVARAVGGDAFLAVSRVIAGTDALTPEVAARIEGLLAARDPAFAGKLADLAAALGGDGDRAARLGALSDGQVAFALAIAKPWYLGYVGDPSGFVLDDDAQFATFLQAQASEKIIDVVPRTTYAAKPPGWWSAPPEGVTPPPMPDGIRDWTTRLPGPDAIRAPDPAWRAYATADHGGVDAARAAKPGAAPVPSSATQ